MISQIYHLIPERIKLWCDVGAGSTLLMSWLGFYVPVMTAIGTTAATIYAVLRLYYYIKDRRAR